MDNDPINLIDPSGLDWVYSQSTGNIHQVDSKGKRISGTGGGNGYAGKGKGVNNPSMQNVPFQGPIPRGEYKIGPSRSSKGPLTLPLNPDPSNTMYGRDSFLIHGDNSKVNRSASEGCIIQGRSVRQQILDSGDKTLRVVK